MRKFLVALLFIFLALCLNGRADTITLKDGTVIEGTITQQDDTQVTVTYHISESITDERILKRAEIDKIEKTPEDSLAFEQLKNLKPDAWAMLSPDTYATSIASLKAFLAKYPQTAHKKEAQSMLDTLLDEQSHQKAGDVKLYGDWVPQKMVAARDYQIQAQALYIKMQSSSQQGDPIGALNTFDQLEKTYPGSRVFPVAIGRAQQIANGLQGEINTAVETLKVKDAEWKQGVAITPEPEKSEMIASRQVEAAQDEAAIEAASKAQIKWTPLIPRSQKSLDALTTLLASEKDRLLGLPVEKMNASIAQSDKAAQSLIGNDLASAQVSLKQAVMLWPANEEAAFWQKIVTAAQTALAHPKPTPVPTRTPAPPKIANTTVAPTAKPAPKVGAAADSSTPAESKTSFTDFLFTIPGAVTVVVCAIGLFLLTSFLQKSKRDRELANEKEEEQQ